METLVNDWQVLSAEIKKLNEEYICDEGESAASTYCRLQRKTEKLNELFCKICASPWRDTEEYKQRVEIALSFYDFGDDDTGIAMRNLTAMVLKYL